MTAQRGIPSVDLLLSLPAFIQLEEEFGHTWVVVVLREVLADIRKSIANGSTMPDQSHILDDLTERLCGQGAITLRKVINASGVLLHTNLGRSPLSMTSLRELSKIGDSYSNLEFDLTLGKRSNRSLHTQDLLVHLLDAEAALVVNNNAAAVLLSLSALAKGKKVAISRSQMIEIGGGFRIPDVMRQSGAKLIEVGTTNRTHLSDYQTAIDEGAEVILLAHPSNFKITGFTSLPSLAEVVLLANKNQVTVIYDIGSGALVDMTKYGLTHEPMVQEALKCGVDLICFSGDKLLGGPQSGIIVGKKALIDKIAKHPLYRALRPDKMILLTLSSTILSYLKGKVETEIPLYRLLSRTDEELFNTATKVIEALGTGTVLKGESTIGGGSMPDETLDTWLAAFTVPNPAKLLQKLREQTPPIIARIQKNQVVCDLRTVPIEDTTLMIENLHKALTATKENDEN